MRDQMALADAAAAFQGFALNRCGEFLAAVCHAAAAFGMTSMFCLWTVKVRATTSGFGSQDSLLCIDCHSHAKALTGDVHPRCTSSIFVAGGIKCQSGSPVIDRFDHLKMPSAKALDTLIACTRSIFVAVTTSVIREAHRGMWMDGALLPSLWCAHAIIAEVHGSDRGRPTGNESAE